MKVKKLLSIFLCILIAVGCVPFAVQNVKAETTPKKITEYDVGNTFEFGWYPQSEVKDGATKTALNGKAGVDSSDIKTSTASWTSYGYYDGTGNLEDGQMMPADYMRYKDVIYNGNKYRGVVFDTYRPYHTGLKSSSDESNTFQCENGYKPNNVYWFKYEPITWRVLDPSTGMVMSKTILDSQAFNNYILESDSYYYGDAEKTYLGNDYEHSSIRKWLNDDFYNTAFSGSQQNTIAVTEVKTQKYGEDSPTTTNDKIYLLSKDDVQNASYGFSSDETRKAQGSDYAKSQGLWVATSGSNSGKSYWRLRSAGLSSYDTCNVDYDGDVSISYDAGNTSIGVRLAFNFNLTSEIVQQPVNTKITYYGVGDTFEFGWYPQSKVEDDAIEANLNKEAEVETNGTASWTSYGYYSNNAASDYMRYTDVVLGTDKYRGVVFDTYRPWVTSTTSSSDKSNTFQDENGYIPNTVYWFKYEPITWRVLEPAKGLVMSENLLDSQAFNNYIIEESGEYYGETVNGNKYYANDFEHSSIRAWLNDDFYNTAFSGSQQNIISETAVETKKFNEDSPTTTNDKIYLLSKDDVQNASYRLDSQTARIAQGSDYAKSQGLYVSIRYDYRENSSWHLRSAGNNSRYTCKVDYDGYVSYYYDTDDTYSGVRPAFNFDTDAAIVQQPVVKEKIGDYGVGDTFEFGWYPQSEVKNEATKTALNDEAGVSSDIEASTASWTSYGYYSELVAGDYMRYKDVVLGTDKYRGVVFDSYRPWSTGAKSFPYMNDDTHQDESGYEPNKVYWFKYEPITWRVLDPSTGMVMSETLLDSQAFNNYITEKDGHYYSDKNNTYLVNDYEHSSIRKWLTDDFYNTAFSGSQQNIIAETDVETQAFGSSSTITTKDKIYLLSEAEATNASYGLGENAARIAQGSDYAKSQGLYNGNFNWLLRSAGHNSYGTCRVSSVGIVFHNYDTNNTDGGVRPAFNFNPESEIVQQPVVKEKIGDYGVGDTFEFGWYPQSKVEDDAIEAELNKKAEVATNGTASWISYGYYSEMTASDYMRYKDVIYNGSKYRGVVFDSYRPKRTDYASSSDIDDIDLTFQIENGYIPNTVYWFKYEPIIWRVLSPEEGLVMSETLLDSQAFNNYITEENGEYYGEPDENGNKYYANDYEHSSIRVWLNDDFMNTAFSGSQQNTIAVTEVKTQKYGEDSPTTTNDKIYLLSKDDVQNASYGFSSDETRKAQGSDYAKSQGLYVSTSGSNSGKSYWRLRSAGSYSVITCEVDYDGYVGSSYGTDKTDYGVRLAFNLNPASAITQSDVTEVGVAKYTVETYTMKTDGEYEKTTASFTGGIGKTAKAVYTVPAGFALGTNSVTEGEILSDGSLVLKIYLDRNKYTLTTVVDGVSTPYEFYYGQTVSGIPVPTKAGYTFAPWSPSLPTTMPAVPITVTTQSTENSGYTVKFNTDGGTPAISDKTGVKWTDKVLDGVQNPTKQGYEFAGWYVGINPVDTDDRYKDFVANDSVTEITLTAMWTEKSEYKIELNANGANTVSYISDVKWSDKVLEVVPTLGRDGYIFLGWYYNNTKILDSDTYGSLAGNDTVESITIEAAWLENSDYTITFNTDGGTPAIEDKIGVKWSDKVLDDVQKPTKQGYTFVGWYLDLTTLVTDTTTYGSLTQNTIELIAHWEENSDYTVKFDTDGGNEIADKTGVKWTDKVLDGVDKPVKAGYTFTGWYVGINPVGADDQYKDLVANDTVASITLKAKWTENSDYTVKFDTDGGINPAITDKTGVKWTDKVLNGVQNPVKSGCTFAGWYVGNTEVSNTSTYGSLVSNDKVLSVELKAKWIDNEKPVITGLEAGKSYCDHVSFNVVDSNGIASVTVNGTELAVTPDCKYTITAEYGEATIVVTDIAGNTESITVTVNEHNYYIGECTECGSEDPNASFFIRLIRYIINWFRSFTKML